MFEFHGWMNILTHDPISGPFDDCATSMPSAMQAIQTRITTGDFDLAGDWLEVRETTNGQIVVAAHGFRSHRRHYAFDLFKWIAEQYPHSYGLIYVNDAEAERDNELTVHRFARGKVREMSDAVLSPIVPTIRDAAAWEDSPGDTTGT